jgi:hypothetical protein
MDYVKGGGRGNFTNLFSLLLEDLELYLQTGHESGLSFDDVILIVLLFTDHMAI